jgi:putative oxidoreductase
MNMKRLHNTHSGSSLTDMALLVARVGIASLMLIHGIPKMMMLFSGDPIQFPPVLGMSAATSLTLTVFAEVFCSIFLLAGFLTRLAVIPLIITMLVAVFVILGAEPVAIKEPALHYLLVYVVLLFAGSGRYSVDHLLLKNRDGQFNSLRQPAFATASKS